MAVEVSGAAVAVVAAVAAAEADAAEVNDKSNQTMMFAFGIITLGMGLVVTPGVAFQSDAPAPTANLPPNSISLYFYEEIGGLPIGREFGYVRATDPNDPNATGVYRFALVEGIGSSHNHLFSLDEKGVLKTAAVLDQETHDSLNIRIRVTDEHGAKLEKSYDLALLGWNWPEENLDDTDEEYPPIWARFLLGAFFCSPFILIFWILATGRKLGDYFGGNGDGQNGGDGGGGCGGCGGGG